MALSTTMLLAGHHPWLTMPAAFLMGAIGTILLVIIPAVLTDRYGNQRAVAIAEANVVASLCSVLAPVIVGLFVGAKLSWRAALVIPVLVAFLFSLVFHQISLPDSVSLADRNHHAEPKLPGLYWAYWSILVLVVSVEFCIIFWGSTFLEKERGFVPANAAAVMSLFLGAMVVGRVLGSRLAYRVRSERLVLGSIGVCGLGFIVHWWTTSPVLTIAGLFVSGIGIANLYPQTLTLAVGVSATLTDQASARASLASGIAILVLPLILGGLADMIGLRYAYGLISVLLLLAGIGIILSDRKPPVPERPGYSCGR